MVNCVVLITELVYIFVVILMQPKHCLFFFLNNFAAILNQNRLHKV